jgi:hypothetical protein
VLGECAHTSTPDSISIGKANAIFRAQSNESTPEDKPINSFTEIENMSLMKFLASPNGSVYQSDLIKKLLKFTRRISIALKIAWGTCARQPILIVS